MSESTEAQRPTEENQPEAPNPLEAFKILESTVEVENRGEIFEFRLPTVLDEIRLGSVAKRVRREADPEGSFGESEGIDPIAYAYGKAVSLFLVCLVRTSAKWVYAADKAGKPALNWQNWPPNVAERVLEISLAAEAAIATFRRGEHGGVGTSASAGG